LPRSVNTSADSTTDAPLSGRGRLVLLIVAGATLGWRLSARPIAGLWKDALAVLAIFAIVTSVELPPRLRTLAVVLVAALLLAVYVAGQFPQTLRVLGLRP